MSLESKISVITDLEGREAELQEAIKSTARADGDSAKLRQDLTHVQQKLKDARQDVASLQAEGRNAAAKATAKLGDELASASVAKILTGTASFAEALTKGVSVPDFTDAPALQGANHNVAHARQRVADAEAALAAAQADVDDLQNKIIFKNARSAELQRLRLAGNESTAAEAYAISQDVSTLGEMVATAQSVVANLQPAVNEARIAASTAEGQASKIETRLFAEHLAAHAKHLESALIACLRECQAAGAKAGIGIGVLFTPTLELRSFVGSGILPAQFRR